MRGGLTEKVAVRMTPAERMGLERLAKVRGWSLSDVMRDAISAMLGLSDDDGGPLQRVNTSPANRRM